MYRNYSIEDYLRLERNATLKSEFYKGEILTMPGASANHNIVTARLLSYFSLCAEKKDNCVAYSNDMLFYSPICPLSAYPDFMVVCGEPQYLEGAENYTLTNPILVGEVLSDSTENYDRNVKLPCYLASPSVEVVILASQKEAKIEVYHKINGNALPHIYTQGKFWVLDCELEMERIYKNIKF
ncbi:MAG: Uma2 family endonuclease [Microscillaceae bacterium]|nr:Uma2 family endonuclease [Microscillaceae bacterium]